MFALRAAATVRAAAPATRSRAATTMSVARRCYTGGVFDKEEAAKENYFMYKREKELIRKLREDLKAKETAALQFLDRNPTHDPEFHEELKTSVRSHDGVHLNAASQGASGNAFSKREAANEERFIRELERERTSPKKH